jgi:sugar phosphate isomerase/epimerase
VPEIALQMWTVRDAYDADPAGTLSRIAELGYPAVEMVYGCTGGLTPADQRGLLDLAGLRVAAMHCLGGDLDGDLAGVTAAAEAFGTDTVVCAWVAPERRGSREAFQALAADLAVVGRTLRERGLRLCYHHHDFELAEVAPGVRGLDVLFDEVPAELMQAEVDVYWVHAAGLDVVSYLESLGDRCALLHLKDHLAEGAEPLAAAGEGAARFTGEIGTGILDIAGAIRAAPGARWLIVEQDFTAGDPFESAGVSLVNLRRLLDR